MAAPAIGKVSGIVNATCIASPFSGFLCVKPMRSTSSVIGKMNMPPNTRDKIAFFGVRDLKNTNQRLCGGLLEFISTNSTGAGGTLTEATWQTFLKQGFWFGSERKIAFCSPIVIAAVEGFARANLKVNDNRAENYGVTMKTYYSGQGIVDLVLHRDWFDSATYGGYAFLVDLDAFKYRPLRDTMFKQNVQAPDYDGVKHEYITEASFEIQHERKHAKLTGVTG